MTETRKPSNVEIYAVRYVHDRAWYGAADNGTIYLRCHHRHGTTVTARKCAAKLAADF